MFLQINPCSCTFALLRRGDCFLFKIPRVSLRLPWARETNALSGRVFKIAIFGVTILDSLVRDDSLDNGGLKAQLLSIAQGKRSGALGVVINRQSPRPERAKVLKFRAFGTFALTGRKNVMPLKPRAPLRLPWAMDNHCPFRAH